MITPGIDHIALTVPDLDEQVDRLTSVFGMVVEARFDGFALITDPASGLKLELGRSEDSQVHFRHFGFRADDVDGAHDTSSRQAWRPARHPTGATSPACTPRSSSSPAVSRSSS